MITPLKLFLVLVLAASTSDAQGPPGGGGGCTCTEDVDYKLARYEETMTNSSTRTIRTMGIPNHPYHVGRVRTNPNHVCLQRSVVTLPAQPVRKAGGNFTATSLGATGILKTGGILFNHLSNFQGTNDVAKIQEGDTLDTCHGHAGPGCAYHYHEISKLGECTHDAQWDKCEVIGYLLDGFPIYSHCFNNATNRFLKSCYSIVADTDGDGGGDTTDYKHIPTNECDLDIANGYDFTGKGIVDNTGKIITGYAYVATDSYPYVMAYYAGSTWATVGRFETWPGEAAPVAAPTLAVAPISAPRAAAPIVVPISAPNVAPIAAPIAAPMTIPAPAASAPNAAPPVSAPVSTTVCTTQDACSGFLGRDGTRIHRKLWLGRCVSRCSTTFWTRFLLQVGWTCGAC